MLTAYIPDSHMLTGSLSPACWTLHPAWALACNLQKPTECKSSAPDLLRLLLYFTGKAGYLLWAVWKWGKYASTSGLSLYVFLILRKSMSVCSSSLSTTFWFSGELKNREAKAPHCHCRTNTLECHLTETDPAFALLTHQIVYFLQCCPQKQKDTQVMAAQMQCRALKYFKLAMFMYSISCMITH